MRHKGRIQTGLIISKQQNALKKGFNIAIFVSTSKHGGHKTGINEDWTKNGQKDAMVNDSANDNIYSTDIP